MPASFDTRVGAYGVLIEHGRILLAHWTGVPGLPSGWTLPGGGMEPVESPEQTATREILEETGYTVRLDTLLGVDSLHIKPAERLDPADRDRELLVLRVIFAATRTGGALRCEEDGSTDDVRWFDLDEVAALKRVDLVDVAIGLWRQAAP